jgi:uncharacterized protein YdhG (YjbR/CyaY superfamily)
VKTPTSVAAYFSSLDATQREALEQLRETIRKAAPAATEQISYQMPAFRDEDRALVAYAAFEGHYSLFPMGSDVLDLLGEEVASYRGGKGTLRFSYDHPLPEALVHKVVRARLAENAARRSR